jgi:hypothetical protein
MIRFKRYFDVLCEGGAAGHMWHPFDIADAVDLPIIKTGKDLINIFNKSAVSLQQTPGSVKIDGVNASIRLAYVDDGKVEFAMDRGSMKLLDTSGVTNDKLSDRFPSAPDGPPHGMVEAGGKVLEIFNTSLPYIESELKALNMYKNIGMFGRFFDMEYVTGGDDTANVLQYNNNFLAIHGVKQFKKKVSPKRGSVSRSSESVDYDKKAIQSLIDKVNPVAAEHGFKLFGLVPTHSVNKIDFTNTLNTEFAVFLDDGHVQTQSLATWLSSARHPGSARIKFADGKDQGAMSKAVYLAILNREQPLAQLIPNEKHQKIAIDGAVLYHATRMLGNDILNGLSSPLGSLTGHEGVVVDDKSISRKPFKITGEFIVTGMTSRHQQNA